MSRSAMNKSSTPVVLEVFGNVVEGAGGRGAVTPIVDRVVVASCVGGRGFLSHTWSAHQSLVSSLGLGNTMKPREKNSGRMWPVRVAGSTGG